MIVLDTHIFVWWNQNDPKLTSYHREVIENERPNGLGVCTISLIEIARLVSAGRIILPVSIQEWFEIALAQEGVILMPITPAIAVDAQSLPGDFHKDPADRIIVATARLSNCSIVTVDQKILNYSDVNAIPPT
jgi:PIN domain nuclease of toxin-antitoxin system